MSDVSMMGAAENIKNKKRQERRLVLNRMGIDLVAKGFINDPTNNYNNKLAKQIVRLDDVPLSPIMMKTDMSEDDANNTVIDPWDADTNSRDRALRSIKSFYNNGLGLGNEYKSGVLLPINVPFQFNPFDDVRVNLGSNKYFTSESMDTMGRVYADNIKQNFQFVDFQLGQDLYNMKMTTFMSDDSSTASNYIRGDSGVVSSIKNAAVSMANFAGEAFKLLTFGLFEKNFVDFKERMPLYFEYINELLFQTAFMMGITDQSVYGNGGIDNGEGNDAEGSFFHYDSGSSKLNNNFSIQSFMGRTINGGKALFDPTSKLRYIRFLINKGVSVSETWSNNTEEHPLMSAMNEASAANDAASKTGGVTSNPFANPREILNGLLSNAANQKIVSNLAGIGSVQSGRGRMVLPNIWSNSSFSRSYTLSFKFYSPLGDRFSIFENCYLPTICLLAMGAPRQIGKVSYMSPFIVRCFSPGLFACNFGIVESMTINKSEEKNERTIDGYSKVMNVTITIKDLIPEFTLSMNKGLFASLHQNNLQLLDWLWVLSGQPVDYRERLFKKIETFVSRSKLSLDNVLNGKTLLNVSTNLLGPLYTLGQRIALTSDDVRASRSSRVSSGDYGDSYNSNTMKETLF